MADCSRKVARHRKMPARPVLIEDEVEYSVVGRWRAQAWSAIVLCSWLKNIQHTVSKYQILCSLCCSCGITENCVEYSYLLNQSRRCIGCPLTESLSLCMIRYSITACDSDWSARVVHIHVSLLPSSIIFYCMKIEVYIPDRQFRVRCPMNVTAIALPLVTVVARAL